MEASFVTHEGDELEGSLVYATQDHAFRFDPGSPAAMAERTGTAGVTSLAIGTLQIEVGVGSRLVLFVWGLHPRAQWVEDRLTGPAFRRGTVEVLYPPGLRRGVSVGLAEVKAWSTVFDPETGWLRVAPSGELRDDTHVLVATGVVLGLRRDGELGSIWLQPLLD